MERYETLADFRFSHGWYHRSSSIVGINMMVMKDVILCNLADKYLAVHQLHGVMSQKRIITFRFILSSEQKKSKSKAKQSVKHILYQLVKFIYESDHCKDNVIQKSIQRVCKKMRRDRFEMLFLDNEL